MSKRRTFTPEFKAQVVLEALTGVRSTAQVCWEHGLKDQVLSRWKQEFLARAPQVFERSKGSNQAKARNAELERMVGPHDGQVLHQVRVAWKCMVAVGRAAATVGPPPRAWGKLKTA